MVREVEYRGDTSTKDNHQSGCNLCSTDWIQQGPNEKFASDLKATGDTIKRRAKHWEATTEPAVVGPSLDLHCPNKHQLHHWHTVVLVPYTPHWIFRQEWLMLEAPHNVTRFRWTKWILTSAIPEARMVVLWSSNWWINYLKESNGWTPTCVVGWFCQTGKQLWNNRCVLWRLMLCLVRQTSSTLDFLRI